MTNDDHYQSLSIPLIEAKFEHLRVEWGKSTRAQRVILKRQAKALTNALEILKQYEAATDSTNPKPPFTNSLTTK